MVLIALVLGWLAPSPSEMGRGLMSMMVSLRGRGGEMAASRQT
ncbi:MAG: hypothetical protein ACO23H_07590 [Alphaproteobacteria bacterium]